MTALRIRSLSKSYGSVAALSDVSFEVEEGSHTAVVGPSASGKSTLLRLIAGFETPSQGEVLLGGDILADTAHSVPAHRRRIGYVAQDGALFPHLTVAGNIGFGLDRSAPDRAAHIAALMDMVGLNPSIGERRPDQLSGGQQQRVAIARALAQQPRLMLLDEPFSALDTNLREATRKAASDLLRSKGITTVLVTHDQPEALSFADRVAILREGTLVQFGTPTEVYERPKTVAIATYLGDAILLQADVADGQATCVLGRLPADGVAPAGRTTIMLRPEQLRLAAMQERTPVSKSVVGEVTGSDYRGSGGAVSILVRSPGAEPIPLVVRHVGRPMPKAGDVVEISVDGCAHVFGA